MLLASMHTAEFWYKITAEAELAAFRDAEGYQYLSQCYGVFEHWCPVAKKQCL